MPNKGNKDRDKGGFFNPTDEVPTQTEAQRLAERGPGRHSGWGSEKPRFPGAEHGRTGT